MKPKLFVVVSFLLIFTFLMTACEPQVKTVEVIKEQVVTKIVAGTPVTTVVTATPAPTKDTSKDPVTLRFTTWTGNETQLKLLSDIAAEYKTKNPNVTVKFETIDQSEYTSKIALQLAGGDPPDVGWMLETQAANWIKAGALSDMGPKLKTVAGYDYADLIPKALSFWVRGEAVYGIPFSTSPFFTIYNIDLFNLAGRETPDVQIKNKTWTFENMAKAAKAIAEKGPKGTYGFATPDGQNLYTTNLWINTTPFVRAYGGELWSDDFTACMMNKPEAVKGLTLFQDMLLVDKSVVPPGENAAFTAGNVGISFGQLSRLGALKDAKFKWGFAPLPSGPAGYFPTIGQAAITVFKAGKNVAWAQDFAAFITSKENVTKLAAFWPPARLSVLNSGVIEKNNPTLDPAMIKAAITESILAGKVVSSHPDFSKVELASRPFFDKLWTGGKVQEQMDAACKALAPYLPK